MVHVLHVITLIIFYLLSMLGYMLTESNRDINFVFRYYLNTDG